MDHGDLRAIRRVLKPDDFALSDGEPDPLPADLISEEAWNHIMTVPGDVAIRSTSYQGSKFDLLNNISSESVFSMPRRSITANTMLEISPHLGSSIFNMAHGHYKTAFAVLCVALESIVLTTRCALASDQPRWQRSNSGDEFKFRNNCDEILNLRAVESRERQATSQFGAGIFQERSRGKKDSWRAHFTLDSATSPTHEAIQQITRFGTATDPLTQQRASNPAMKYFWKPMYLC